MNILAVDTTGESLSLALQAGERVFSFHRKLKTPHDEALLPRVGALLSRAGLALGDLDAIAAASGPGRFTGIRIGMAYAAVASARMKIPALAVSLFEAAAYRNSCPLLCAAVRGWRDERYYRLFRRRGKTMRAAGEPGWAPAADWPAIKASMEQRGFFIAEDETSAADLLAPAAAYLRRARRPRFEPLYLKPAGYERKGKTAS